VQTLLLLRHAAAGSNRDGTTSCAPPGPGLTAEGVAQARRAGDLLAGEEVSLGVATRLLRTQETLDQALAGRVVARLLVPELDEIDFGSFEGGSLADYRAWASSHPPDEPAPGGGESRGLGVVLERPEAVALLVGHALFVRYVLDAAEGLVPASLMAPVDHASPYRLDVRDVEAAARLLADWSLAPRFRDPPEEGRVPRP
jgi:broad specificity phosphatase PhoE